MVKNLRAVFSFRNASRLRTALEMKDLVTLSCLCRARMRPTSETKSAREWEFNIKNGGALPVMVASASKFIATMAARSYEGVIGPMSR